MTLPIFITGTDTGVGKTTVACGLLQVLRKQGYSVLGIKPLASGCELTAAGLRSSDALQLQQHSSITLDYAMINPIAFAAPIAPHIAAEQVSQELSVSRLIQLCQPALSLAVDVTIVEGVGGWMVPLNRSETMADFVQAMQWPVIMVVGMRLGCINHALLTLAALRAAKIPLLGWVANFIQEDMQAVEKNIATLQQRLAAPCLALIPYNGKVSSALNLSKIEPIFQ